MFDTTLLDRIEKAIGDRDSETLKKLATIETTTREVGQRVFEIEQKMADGVTRRSSSRNGKSLGQQFVEGDSFRALQALPEQSRKGRSADLICKATITSLTTDAAGSAGAGVQPEFRALEALPKRRRVVRDLLPQVQITSSSVEVPTQKSRNLNAAPVAETNAKPQSDLQLELKTFPARVIAHWMKASRQIVDDVPQLSGLIDGDLLYGLQLVEETQLLYGDNTGQNLYGLTPQASAYSDPLAATSGAPPIDNYIDIIGRAMLQSALAEYPADGVIMHPSDWMTIRLTKDSQGRYIYGPPGEAVEPRIFGEPVVPTQAITADKFLVGQFARVGTIFDRWEARVETGFVDDDFIKNLITVLAEERLALAVTRPAAMIYGDFSDALG